MRLRCSAWLTAVTLILLIMSAPDAARGEDLIVEHIPAANSGHFPTIQAAIDNATSRLIATPTANFIIRVKADATPYSGPITPISNVPIVGDSTAGTFISGNGAGALINLSNVSSVAIRNFTFRSALTGISITNSSSINITNNVFQLGTAGTAIQVVNSTSTSIINNTFFNNGTAISTNSDITITNDIFSTNSSAISAQIPLTISYNDFFANAANGVADLGAHSIPNALVVSANPLFVDSANRDFHLQSDSPCVNSGNPQYPNSFGSATSDMGAYGGPNSDIVLAAVTGLTASVSSATPSTILLNWNPSINSKVTAYRVYYGTSSGNYDGTQAAEGASPFQVLGGTTSSATLSGLPLTAPPIPSAPILTAIASLNQALQISWTSVPGATGYRISYGTDASSLSNSFDVDGTALSTQIPGLTNGTTYFVAVSALAQIRFFTAVTAVIDSALPSNPGSANETSFSQETSQGVGPVQESGISNFLSDFPEAIAPFPNLKGEGCFIATAAYGFYSAPQVQALRDFRDRYLLTSAPGRAFVAWYYRYGPRGAHFINAHPWLKAPVRLALFPLVVGALVLTGTAPLAKIAIVMLSALLLAVLLQRNMPVHARHTLKKFTLILFLIITPGLALGAETRTDRPHWSLELKGGAFFPDQANWSKFYDESYTGEYGGALSYKVYRQLEVGIEGSYLRATGKGQQPVHATAGSQVQAGDVTYELLPLNVFVLARGVFSEDQWLVPYAAAGWTRLFYREEVKGQATTRGSVNGYHTRGGVQLLLDGLESDASHSLYLDYGVHHTYLFLEAKYLHALADTVPAGSVNIGGTSCLGGFLFEF